MEAIMVAKISYMATTYDLLPTFNFRGRRGSFVETAIYHLLVKIYGI